MSKEEMTQEDKDYLWMLIPQWVRRVPSDEKLDKTFFATLSREELDTLSVYQVSELSEELRGTKRLLCSKTALGQEVTTSLNQTLARIFANPEKSEILRDTNFRADGYSHRLKPLFDERWDTFLSKK